MYLSPAFVVQLSLTTVIKQKCHKMLSYCSALRKVARSIATVFDRTGVRALFRSFCDTNCRYGSACLSPLLKYVADDESYPGHAANG